MKDQNRNEMKTLQLIPQDCCAAVAVTPAPGDRRAEKWGERERERERRRKEKRKSKETLAAGKQDISQFCRIQQQQRQRQLYIATIE